jgi:Transglutaminase-like superfamily
MLTISVYWTSFVYSAAAMSGATGKMEQAGDAAVNDDVWAAAVDAIVPVPADHRRLDADAAAVQALLRCGPEGVEELARTSLAREERGGELFFDPVDVYNVGLLSGSGRSVPEMASSFFARLAAMDSARWVAPAATEVVAEWPAAATGDLLEDEFATLRADGGEPGGSRPATYEPRGVRRAASPRLTTIYDALLAEFSFQLLPPTLKWDTDAVVELAVGDCDGLSGVMAARCAEAGFKAYVERGHVRGGFGWGGHAWVRVIDEDDSVIALDPTLPLVAASQGAGIDAFAGFCRGGLVTRVVPVVLRAADLPPVSLALPTKTITHS